MKKKTPTIQAPFETVHPQIMALCESSYEVSMRLTEIRLETMHERRIVEQLVEAMQLLAAVKWNVTLPNGPLIESDTNDESPEDL